ncbi:coiled-coil domain-containing protein 115 isoform X2 [Syngnathoides biaculeatus]|uniref:coiled-coil domain-containing protein 115 isoform X2 n=1 Tax=Syngnathoides biaculeatus TaxID=300417 RepID=UPI002ADE95CF|nr:coiled-coil domain-containing protein 115 isoform X2 [Syngnathoides biaculeatus]
MDESAQLLDEKILTFMDQLELLEEKRARLNTLIEQGWFFISKARYSMGNKQVSALQYASEIKPQVSLHVSSESPKYNSECHNTNAPVEVIGPQEEGIRRRIKPTKGSGEMEAVEELSHKKSHEDLPASKTEENPQQNPLHWFGILVPQSLKQAQMSFKQVIELSAEIATLQVQILNTRQELMRRFQEKDERKKKKGDLRGC